MKILFASAAIALLAGTAQAETRPLADFTGISASAGTRVEMAIGPIFSVDVEGRDAAKIVTRVEAGRLIVERERGWNWGGRREALVRVSMPSVEALEASSGARLDASGVDAETLELEASSGAVLTVSGACRSFTADASSGAVVRASELHCVSGAVDASSGASVTVHASGALDVDASSGADVVAAGSPQIGDISLSSGGSLHRR